MKMSVSNQMKNGVPDALRVTSTEVEKAMGLRKLPTLTVSSRSAAGNTRPPKAGALRLLTAVSLASGAKAAQSTAWGGVESPFTIGIATVERVTNVAMYALMLTAVIIMVPKSARRLAMLATMFQTALATWNDTSTVVESALSTYATYVLVMVPITLALAGVEVAEFSCSTASLIQATADAMTGLTRHVAIQECERNDTTWANLQATSIAKMATNIAVEAARRANR